MGTRTGVRKCSAFMVALVLGSHLITIAESSKVWGEVPFPEDLEATKLRLPRYLDDDEDFNADEASGDFNSGEDGSTPEPDSTIESTTTIYYRAMVNFTDSLVYSHELDDLNSFAFQEISSAVVDTLESDYQRIPGTQMVNVVLVKQIGRDVFVELDVGSDDNRDEAQIREVLYSVVREGTIGSYTVSEMGFEFRRLGEVVVKPGLQLCGRDQFTCHTDFSCIPMGYFCDGRAHCADGSDEINCVTEAPPITLPQPRTTPESKIPPRPGPCRVDQATCQSGECIPLNYLCDDSYDCSDGSDELNCGTPSPCEPNEFKCRNGRCTLKLWRCDGDNDCDDNSDEMNCPTKKPGDVCAPEQFICLSDSTCIPASYQCDEEPDCPDRSDEYGCAPPTVTSPPEESVTVARGQTVTFTCSAIGVPTPIITWRLNWGHIPASNRITMTSESGRGTLIIRDVKEGDQGAYTCEAINAKGMVFAIPDGVLTLTRTPSNCPDGHFNLGGRCVPCFCFGVTKNCQSSGRYRNQISLRFNEEENFKGANVSFPSRPGSPPPLSSTQLLVNPEVEEFQLVDLSRRFLDLESYWTLPRQFLGSKVDSYGGSLRYKVSYSLQRDTSEPVEKPDVILRGNGNRLIYHRRSPTVPNIKNHREIKFTEENWQHSSGRQVTREELLMTLGNLESINIRTVYDNRMASVGLSDVIMDNTRVEFSLQGHTKDVEECRCPPGYSGLSCESCSSGFERVPGGQYLGTCAGCNCYGHASVCDPVSGHCLSCQHNTEGPQCDKCRPGYFGDPKRGRPDDCKPCPCPYTESSRRFSDTCFLDTDGQTTCDACREGYTGRRCERCAYGYVGNPLQPNGQCVLHGNLVTCDNRGTVSSSSRPCVCKSNVVGASCEECKPGSFHLSADNPDGCLQCFCMGVTKQCASSTWTRDQVRGGINGQLFSLTNRENTVTIADGISQRGGSEVVFRTFNEVVEEVYYWVLPENFQGDKVTAYGGVLRYKVRFEPRSPSLVISNQPDVVLQGNDIFLEHFSQTKPLPRVPATITVPFRESAWRRADGQPCTREHLLMALADIRVFMIRATYAYSMIESSVADIQMDIAVPHSTGNQRALEVEECACPAGYRGPSCQECDVGYTRTGSGLYLGTCERCECHGHASRCDSETGACLQCQHNTAGPRCESCLPGFFGDPVTGGPYACRLCPCLGPPTGDGGTRPCYMDTDGHATCNCPAGYTGRRCERCVSGYTGNPELGQSCTAGGGSCQYCDQRGSEGCGSDGVCRCKMNVEGSSCTSCKPGTFHLSRANKDGCLACFCMGVTQQCSSSPFYRDVISSDFARRNPQGFALVNRQRTNRITDDFSVELSTDGSQLSYTRFEQHSQEPHFWQLPSNYQGDKVSAYGGKLRYTISYVPEPRGAPIEDVDVQIIGNDITLVARQDWRRGQASRESRNFEIVFREEFWQRPDGMPATREHLLMVLADLDDVLIRATYHTAMRSSSISSVSMEFAVPTYTGLAQAVEVEQCRCPPGYQGLSCQDCAPGYTRTGGGLYLGHCEPCDCNSHSDSCHPETGVCTNCQHSTMGEQCDQCGSGYFGDASAGTPEDCQRCACPSTDPENQFSSTCESLGNGDHRCTACQPAYTGQYCDRCAPGYVRDPQSRKKCLPFDAAASMVVRVYPDRVSATQGSSVTLRCQGSGPLPHNFYWTRDDGRPISGGAERRKQGEELHFSSVKASDAGVYTCTCRNQFYTNRSRAEIIVTTSPSKPIEVSIEEPKSRSVTPGATVSFICTARSRLPAYTIVWTRQGNGKLPNRAMDFNGILTIQNVRPEDAGVYVCTGSNMLGMDEGTAVLHIPAGEVGKPTVTIHPPTLTIQQGQRAELRCTATGNPPPTVEWTAGPGKRISSSAIIRGGILIFPSVERSDQGDYTCRALNVHGEHAARTVLYVQGTSAGELVKPTVTIHPPALTVRPGQRAEFQCTTTGNPAPTVQWTGGPGNRISSSAIIRGGVLIFPSVERSDQGDYTCRALNAHGEHAARAVLYVHGTSGDAVGKPTVTIHPPTLTIQQGRRAEFRCTATGNPTPTVEWTAGPGKRISSSAIIRGGVLIFPSVERSDEGDYTCRALNIHGEHAARAVLYVHSASLPHVQVSPQQATVHEGETLRLYCRAGGTPSPGLTWKRRGGSLPPQAIPSHGFHQFKSNSLDALQRRIEELQARMERTDFGTLLIPNVKMSDSGTYLCIATNDAGSSEARIEVTVLPGDSESSEVSIYPSVASVAEGGTLELTCNVPGSPPSAVRWSRADGRPLSSNHQIIGTQLRILRASREDSGDYVCRVYGGPDVLQASVSVTITGPEHPGSSEVGIYPPVASVPEGGALELNCNIPGSPPSSVRWSRADGHPLSSNHQIIGTQLRILRASREDSGDYICRVDEGPNVRQASISVTVTGPEHPGSSEVGIYPPVASVPEGGMLELNCNIRGSPSSSVRWSRADGRPLSSNHQIIGTQLRILRASREDAGDYICTVYDGPNVRQASISVTVTGPEHPGSSEVGVNPSVASVPEGGTLELNCNIPVSPSSSVRWSRADGRPLSSNHQIIGTQLRILRASREDAGDYICTVYDGPNVRQASISVTVTSPEHPDSSEVGIYPPVISVVEGGELELNCNIPGSPLSSVRWSRADGRPLSSNHQIIGTQLRILRASREDAGDYICKAYEGPNVRQASISVAVTRPELTSVPEGKTLELNCNIPGSPSSSVRWSRADGRPLSSNHQVIGTQLRILRASREHAGDYICTVYDGPNVRQASISVTVTRPEHPGSSEIGIHHSSITSVEGETLELDCIVSGSPPPPVIWRRADGRPLASNHQVSGRKLQIIQASQEDSGKYICRISGGPDVLQASVFVSSESTHPGSSEVSIYPSAASVVEGESLELTCNVPGHPPPAVVWSRADGRPLSSNHQVFGTQLRILRASPEDAGDYTCRVEGRPHHHNASVSVSISSESFRLKGPIISIEPHRAAVKIGDSARFKCRVHSGAQPIRLQWKLANNQPLPDNVRISPDGSVITITDAQVINQGAYHCLASNPFGITDSLVSLVVRESPRAIVTPAGPVHVRVGDPINLECQASGEPRPSVTWHRLDNNRKSIMSSPVPGDANTLMQILVARPEDSGTYVCTAQNNQGRTETQVEVVVEGGPQVPTVPRASVREPLMVVVEGGTATLHCDAYGFPKPTITWSKLHSTLPRRHKIVNGSLVLPTVGRQDSGQYICNATNPLGTSEGIVMLDVETPPYTKMLPDDVAVRVGEVIRLQCLAHGTPPLSFEWSKVDGELSARAEIQEGDLQINLASPSDAGSYKCVAKNNVGQSEAVAKVSVRSPLSVRVSPQVEVKALGSAVEFTCSASGGPEITLEWLKEGGALPNNHHIKDGVLRIENLEKSNEGMYICRASTLFGQAQDSAKLTIQALPKVMINVRTSVQTVMVGTSVEFECQAEGEPVPTLRWSKEGGPLPDYVRVKGGMLRIDRVTDADAGQYRCTATNDVGSVESKVVLNIQSLPQIVAHPETKDVTVGSTAVLPCIASGYPIPTITWSKQAGELPQKCVQDGHALNIPDVTHEDSGTYVCTASNKQGKVEALTTLKVHERVMPYFSQEPLSYLTLPTIKNSYKEFKISVTFRPDNVDGLILYSGMILYNGQKRTMGADFISLGLVGGRPEFRFDVGSGMATIRYPTAVKLGEFHTVQLYRNGTKGSIIVDGSAPINGTSQGKFQGLDLNEELFVGGYPNYSMIAKTAELKSGFVGCISQLIIQGEEVIFKDLDRSSTGVSKCPTCKDRPCQNGGVCYDSVASLYKCSCSRGFAGSNCQHKSSQHCHPEACGPDATCINRPTGVGYDCRCHLGKYGHKCMDGTLVTTPLFDGDESYIAYPPLSNIHNDLRVDLEFKALDIDGLMFFSGGKKMKVEDFVTLSLVDSHVEFRYELGTGQAILRSQGRVTLGQWHRVTAERLNQDGSLKLDDGPMVRRSSPGKAQGLNIHTPMYLGGVPSMDILPKPANISMPFEGCIGEVSINGKKVDLSYSFTESTSVSQCIDGSPCDRRPCQHGGTCMSTAEYEFQCLCRDGYEGERCEVTKDTCVDSSQCQNGGSCVNGHCACPAGFTGIYCQQRQEAVGTEEFWSSEEDLVNDSPVQYAAHFHDDGYLTFPNPIFPRSAPTSPETIELEIKTFSSDGLILWEGVAQGEPKKGKDFISLGMQNGHLVFSYQLGSGEAQIISRERISDGVWHRITAVRTGKQGYVQVDDGAARHGQSQGNSVRADTNGNMYLGGAPDVSMLTSGKFSSGVTGCLRNLSLMNARPGEQSSRRIDLQLESGVNVQRCTS